MHNNRIFNVLVAGHAQHGKSSLIGSIVGKFPDILDYEITHGTTVSLKVIQFFLEKQKLLFNFLDSPGHADFKGGIALGLEFADLLLLVVSGNDGFQARTFWLFKKAIEKNIPIIIAATKMDLNNASIQKIQTELEKLGKPRLQIIETSSKEKFGFDLLVEKLSIYSKVRKNIDEDLSFIILGYSSKKGFGDLINVGLLSGTIHTNKWITDKIKIRQLFSLNGKAVKNASEGEIIQISLNIAPNFELGSKYQQGRFFSPKINSLLAEIQPRKEFFISIKNPEKFKIAVDLIDNIKKVIPAFDFYIDRNNINIQVQGDLQFDFVKNKLEQLIEFKIEGSKIKGIITINKISKGKYNSAKVRIAPRFRRELTINQKKEGNKIYEILGTTAAYEAFNLDGLHVDIYSGKNEEDIAQAITKAIEKVKLIKIIPQQDIIVKVENYHDLIPLLDKFNIEVLYQSQVNDFFLQVKNEDFEDFFNSLMKVSKGKADIHLFKFDLEDIILSIDPGTRHYGFCLIQKDQLPSLWYVNLKNNIENKKTHNLAKKQLTTELDIFLENRKELINKIFIGSGPGDQFIIDFFVDYFSIPCEDYSCVIKDVDDFNGSEGLKDMKERFAPPEVFLVDEFKTTKEALFHLQKGELVNEVKAKGFVDHAIAALLIAKRGIKGEFVKIQKKPLKQLYDYVNENYSGTHSFKTIHNITSIDDLKVGTFLRVKDSSKLDSNLNNGDVISFIGFGNSYQSVHASFMAGNKIIVKFYGDVKVRRDFFTIFSPVKERVAKN